MGERHRAAAAAGGGAPVFLAMEGGSHGGGGDLRYYVWAAVGLDASPNTTSAQDETSSLCSPSRFAKVCQVTWNGKSRQELVKGGHFIFLFWYTATRHYGGQSPIVRLFCSSSHGSA